MSVIDRDESLYLLIAESWLNGNPPYTEIWDNKPPGIFLLLAIAFQILGEPIFAMRFLAIITVTCTCYFLYLIGKNIDDHQGKYIGLLAGILYSIYSLNNGGTATNGEIIFAPFVTAAMVIFWQISQELNRQNQFAQDQSVKLPLLKIFTMGLLFGLAMQIKYVVVTEIAVGFIFLTIYVIFTEKKSHNPQFLTGNFWRKLIKVLLCFTSGLILPLLAIALYYLIIGDFAEYIYATITANTKYVAGTSFNINLFTKVINKQISRNFLLWSSLLYLPIYYCFIRLKQKYQFSCLTEINIIYLLIWLIFTFISVSISKKFFPHYFLQILPPLCLITSFLIIKTIYIQPILNIKKRHLILLIIFIYPFTQKIYNQMSKNIEFVYYRWLKKDITWDDREAMIASYLKPRLNKNDYIYIVNHQPIIYYLTQAKIPTKYPFPSHLTSLSQMLPVHSIQELHSIMSKNPQYIIMAKKDNIDPNYLQVLNSYLYHEYFLENTIENVELYRRKSS